MFIAGLRDTQISLSPRGAAWERLFLAPEGRHVYSRAGYTNIIKPQRGGMSIEGRLVQEQHSSGVHYACYTTLRSSGAQGLGVPRFYRHAAPLGRGVVHTAFFL